ncbi:MAG: tetratricopeptide repeat protein [Proteobacteria bacterium]|nr:tetratricopeptide repeat protein [Pseudomonadota bacterium]MCH8214834.1 tetratricopeptide repeat protein [Pseudomonadota bacterium]
MADPVEDSLFREIEEDLRQEHWAKLWKRYGNYAVGAVLALVLSVAGYQGWRVYDIATRQSDGERFAAALKLADDKQTQAAAEAFAGLAADATAGYALLARFQEAALLAKRGDPAAAYAELAQDPGVDAVYRDLAVILGAFNEMNGPGAGDLSARLAPLTADGNPWHHSAKELIAVLAARAGDRTKARALFTDLAADATAPQGIRARASEMLAILGQ